MKKTHCDICEKLLEGDEADALECFVDEKLEIPSFVVNIISEEEAEKEGGYDISHGEEIEDPCNRCRMRLHKAMRNEILRIKDEIQEIEDECGGKPHISKENDENFSSM